MINCWFVQNASALWVGAVVIVQKVLLRRGVVLGGRREKHRCQSQNAARVSFSNQEGSNGREQEIEPLSVLE